LRVETDLRVNFHVRAYGRIISYSECRVPGIGNVEQCTFVLSYNSDVIDIQNGLGILIPSSEPMTVIGRGDLVNGQLTGCSEGEKLYNFNQQHCHT
jgi:hypothetical protein